MALRFAINGFGRIGRCILRAAVERGENLEVVLINDIEGEPPQPGQIRRLAITETHDYDILGTLLPVTETWSGVSAAHGVPGPSLISITPAVQLPAR